MRLLLVNPWYVSPDSQTRDYPSEPLGLLSLATTLKHHGVKCDVRILDAHLEGPETIVRDTDGWRSGMTDREFSGMLEEWKPDAVGISCNYTFGARTVLDMAQKVRRWSSACKVILGGAHATLDAENLSKHSAVDVVVKGEGELALLDLVPRLGREVEAICSWPVIADVNELPIPDRTLVDYRAYLAHPAYFHTRQSPVGTVFTSRGCPFRCMFCSTQATWGNSWRGRSPVLMAAEAEYLRDGWGVREIAFQDDQLLGSPERMAQFCRLMIGKGFTFIAPPGISPCKLSPGLIDLMAGAGFYRLCLSVDAGSQRIAKFIKKPIVVGNLRPLVRHAHRRGVWTYGTLVIGHPTETRAEIMAGIRNLWRLKLDFLRVYIAQPHVGSELFSYWEARGKVKREDLLGGHDIMRAMFGNGELSAGELEALRNKAEGGYVWRQLLRALNPFWWWEVWPLAKGWARLKYALRAVLSLPKIRLTTGEAKKPG